MNGDLVKVNNLLKYISTAGSIYAEYAIPLASVIAELESRPAATDLPQEFDADLLAAVAQGWCAPENAHKVMDSDLATAIVRNVQKAIDSRTPAAPVVAEGWQIVPSHATPEMLKAFFAEDYTQNGYIEMLKAAPVHPVAPTVVAEDMVLAPLNPSSGMLERACQFDIFNNIRPHGMAVAEQIYEAMIATWMAETAAHPVAGSPAEDDQAFDRQAEATTRAMGLGNGTINPKAASIDDLFNYPDAAEPVPAEMFNAETCDQIRAVQLVAAMRAEAAAPVSASEAAKQTLPQSECNAALRAAPASRDDANIAAGEWMVKHGYGNQSFLYALADLQARIEAKDREGLDLARKYFAAETELAARFRVQGGNTKLDLTDYATPTSYGNSTTTLAAPAAPTDARPDGSLIDEVTKIASQSVRDAAQPNYDHEELREAVSDFRKATYEFAKGQRAVDHAAMLTAQRRIFDYVRGMEAQPTAAPGKEL